MVIAA
jgi:hypothetical protein